MMEKTPYRLVATDVNMPGMNGIELAQKVKENTLTSRSYSFPESYAKEDIARVTNGEFLAKPFRIGQLEELIQRVLAKTDEAVPVKRLIPCWSLMMIPPFNSC